MRFWVNRAGTLILGMMAVLPESARAESPTAYLTHNGRLERSVDLHAGLSAGLPGGTDRAHGRLGGRIGVGYAFPALAIARHPLGVYVSALYGTRAVAFGPVRWTFSLAQAELLAHAPLPGLPWLEPALLIAPGYVLDFTLAGGGGVVPAGEALGRRFACDAGAALLVNVSVFQLRAYYAWSALQPVENTHLSVSAAGLDLLLPLHFRRRAP